MGKHSRSHKSRNMTGPFLFAAVCLVGGLFLLWSLVLSPGGGPVTEADPPSISQAPQLAEKRAEKEPEKPKASDKDKKKTKKEDSLLAGVPAPDSVDMYLTVPKMGISGDYVANGVDDATLYNGAGHAPNSGFPWQKGANTYIASHVLGYAGTGSYLHFAQLPNMTYGDKIYLTDANGTEYTYNVSEILQVSIYDTWVMDPTGKDQVSLQTCINPPAYDVRLVVRGDLVDVKKKTA